MSSLTFDKENLKNIIADIFQAEGLSSQDSDIIAKHLVLVNLRGVDPHGVTRIKNYTDRIRSGIVEKNKPTETVKETAVSALLDGNNQLGILSATEGINLAIDKAKQTGVGILGINNSNHCGMLADYTGYAAEQGYVAMATTNTPPNMAPWGGRERYFGTNPFSYAVPTGNGPPIIFDMATSVVARGKIKLAVKNNTEIPIGWALTKDGESTTDAREAMDGVVLPVGGPKGYGLAFLVEVLSGLFTGAGFASHIGRPEDLQTRQNIGQFYFVMRTDLFQEIEEFYRNVSKFKEEIRTIPLAKGYDRIYLPGEIEQEKMLKRTQEGIPLSKEVISEINEVAESYGVNNRLE